MKQSGLAPHARATSSTASPDTALAIAPDDRAWIQHAIERYFIKRHGRSFGGVYTHTEQALALFKHDHGIREPGVGPETTEALLAYRRATLYALPSLSVPAAPPATYTGRPGPPPPSGLAPPPAGVATRGPQQAERAAPPSVQLSTAHPEAESRLRAELQARGRGIEEGRVYVVQIDRANRSARDLTRLKGQTYVFRGDTDGSLRSLGVFESSSQPTAVNSRFVASQRYGVAHMTPGFYQVNARREGTYGGAFRIGTTAAGRDANRNGVIEPNERRGVRATGMLFHSAAYGSAGCQTLLDFEGFAAAIRQRSRSHQTFDYLLVHT